MQRTYAAQTPSHRHRAVAIALWLSLANAALVWAGYGADGATAGEPPTVALDQPDKREGVDQADKRQSAHQPLATPTATGAHSARTESTGAARPKSAAVATDDRFEKKWGVRILGARLTAGGYLVDFRYRVVDAERARPLFSRAVNPVLIDQATGAIMAVPNPPKVGPLRQTNNIVLGKTYFILFANPGNYIKRGNKTTVVIGDFRADNLAVQ